MRSSPFQLTRHSSGVKTSCHALSDSLSTTKHSNSPSSSAPVECLLVTTWLVLSSTNWSREMRRLKSWFQYQQMVLRVWLGDLTDWQNNSCRMSNNSVETITWSLLWFILCGVWHTAWTLWQKLFCQQNQWISCWLLPIGLPTQDARFHTNVSYRRVIQVLSGKPSNSHLIQGGSISRTSWGQSCHKKNVLRLLFLLKEILLLFGRA